MRRTVLLVVTCVSLPWSSLNAQSFDGEWSVLQVCETTQEGARSYTWRYGAIVKDGHFVGQYRNKGQSPSMTLEGQIKADGTASLSARGIGFRRLQSEVCPRGFAHRFRGGREVHGHDRHRRARWQPCLQVHLQQGPLSPSWSRKGLMLRKATAHHSRMRSAPRLGRLCSSAKTWE
jgi:hypothetical protein